MWFRNVTYYCYNRIQSWRLTRSWSFRAAETSNAYKILVAKISWVIFIFKPPKRESMITLQWVYKKANATGSESWRVTKCSNFDLCYFSSKNNRKPKFCNQVKNSHLINKMKVLFCLMFWLVLTVSNAHTDHIVHDSSYSSSHFPLHIWNSNDSPFHVSLSYEVLHFVGKCLPNCHASLRYSLIQPRN